MTVKLSSVSFCQNFASNRPFFNLKLEDNDILFKFHK